MPVGKSIRVYLADATVSGIRHAEVANWTGQAIACPRNRLGELSTWPETSKPGIYFLFEARFGDSKPLAYIGESENAVVRLTTHDRVKDFWNEVVIFTSKDENLTKAHIKYLEAALVGIAKAADRYALQNGNLPPVASLPRADRDAMAEFIESLRMVLGTLGYPILEPLIRHEHPLAPDRLAYSVQSEKSTALDLVFKINGLTAYGALTDEGFVLKKGSQVSKRHGDSAAGRVLKTKENLVADGRLIEQGESFVLQEDFLISSSSYAAVLVAGTSRSGPQSWKTLDGRTLKAVEDFAVSDAKAASTVS